MNKKFRYLFVFVALALVLSLAVISASDRIYPTTMMPNRGVGVQIRPANQMNLPDDGNGRYSPFQGSFYASRA